MRVRRYSVAEVSRATGLCKETLRRWLRNGRIPATRQGRWVYVAETDLGMVLAQAASPLTRSHRSAWERRRAMTGQSSRRTVDGPTEPPTKDE